MLILLINLALDMEDAAAPMPCARHRSCALCVPPILLLSSAVLSACTLRRVVLLSVHVDIRRGAAVLRTTSDRTV